MRIRMTSILCAFLLIDIADQANRENSEKVAVPEYESAILTDVKKVGGEKG